MAKFNGKPTDLFEDTLETLCGEYKPDVTL